jgi:Protein of unknown function (DUF4058)
MPSPFPGMDPYLESPDLWPEVHHRLISAIAIDIAPSLRPKYRVAIEKRTYLTDADQTIEVGVPDIAVLAQTPNRITATATRSVSDSVTVTLPVPHEMNEGYLEIREVATGRVITVIEVLSPTNKRSGKGQDAYEEKRRQVLSSPTHLIEIDLLRSGTPPQTLGTINPSHYRILVGRKEHRPQAQLYAFNVQQPIPCFSLPLVANDEEPIVDLNLLLNQIYDQASFDLTLDYEAEANPPLKADDRTWARNWLNTHKAQQA